MKSKDLFILDEYIEQPQEGEVLISTQRLEWGCSPITSPRILSEAQLKNFRRNIQARKYQLEKDLELYCQDQKILKHSRDPELKITLERVKEVLLKQYERLASDQKELIQKEHLAFKEKLETGLGVSQEGWKKEKMFLTSSSYRSDIGSPKPRVGKQQYSNNKMNHVLYNNSNWLSSISKDLDYMTKYR